MAKHVAFWCVNTYLVVYIKLVHFRFDPQPEPAERVAERGGRTRGGQGGTGGPHYPALLQA